MFAASGAVEILSQDPDALARAGLEQFLAEAGQLRSWLDAREAKGLAAVGRRDRDPSDPAPDAADKLRRKQNCSRGEARRRAKRAEQLDKLPATRRAMEDGEISSGHADAMARGREHADPQARAALAEHEVELLARGSDEAPEAFARRVADFVKAHAGDDGREDWDRKQAQIRLRLTKADDGMTDIRGRLDPELADLVGSTLRRKAEELWRGEAAGRADETMPWVERTSERRLAQALGEVCRRAEGAEVRDGRRVPGRAIVTMDLDVLLGRLGEAHLPDGTPIPASVARRVACTAGLVPAVLGGESIPLDWGRARRFATATQRDALGLLYDTCTIAGCTAPKAWCDVHHIEVFEPDGQTNLDNLTFACGNCHDLVHRPGWRVAKDPDGTVHTWAPDGTHWEHHPNATRRRRSQPQPAATVEPDQEQFAGV